MLTKNNTSSDLTRKRQTRMQFANYIIQQQAVTNGCLRTITLQGGSGGDKMASIFTDIKDGERFTTAAERALILASDSCPTTSSSSDGGSGPTPDPPTEPGRAMWGIGLIASTTSNGSQTRASWIDTEGNIYIAGEYTNGKLTINNYTSKSDTTITQTTWGLLPSSSTVNAGFIIKYNSSGSVLWATNVTASSGSICYNIATDSNNNVYSLHQFRGTATVRSYTSGGGDGGDVTLTSYGTSDAATADDVLIVKHNSSGVAQWMAQITGAGNDMLLSVDAGQSKNIAIDSNGNIHFTIRSFTVSANTITFKSFSSGGSGVSTTFTNFGTITSTYTAALYVCKMNSSGVFQWVAQVNPTEDNPTADQNTAVDSDGNVYVAFSTAYNFELKSYTSVIGGAITTTLWGTHTAIGARDGYVAKLNSSGAFTACALIATSLFTVSTPFIVIDSNNNIFVSYRYSANSYNANNKTNIYSYSGTDPAGGSISFTAWASLPTISTSGNAGIIKFNSSLEAQAATHITSATAALTTARAFCYGIDRDADNNLLVSVYFSGENLTIYNYSSGGGGLNVNITTTTFGTLANSGTSGTFKTGLVKFDSSLVAQWATRLNDTSNIRSVIAYTTSVDRTNGFVYYGGVFVQNNSGGLELYDYTGVSGGAVQLTLFATVPTGSTGAGINQAFLVKYKI